MGEVIHTEGNVRLVQDDEPGEFPSWGDGGFQLISFERAGWFASTNLESDDLPPIDRMEDAIERWEWVGGIWGGEILQRWLRAFYNPKATVKMYTGYSQGDYWLVASMEGDTDTSDQIAAWAMGDVWRLALEYRVVYELATQRANLPVDADLNIEMWVRDGDAAATAYGEADREAIIAEFKHEMEHQIA